MADVSDSLQTNALAPKSATGDSGSVEMHSIADQIAADKYLASKAASKAKRLGIRLTKIVAPGAG